MASWQVTLIDESSANVAISDLQDIANALQQQLDRDFSPIWGVHALVGASARGSKVPARTWPIKLIDDLGGDGGVHLDKNNKPYAEAVVGPELTVAISH